MGFKARTSKTDIGTAAFLANAHIQTLCKTQRSTVDWERLYWYELRCAVGDFFGDRSANSVNYDGALLNFKVYDEVIVQVPDKGPAHSMSVRVSAKVWVDQRLPVAEELSRVIEVINAWRRRIHRE